VCRRRRRRRRRKRKRKRMGIFCFPQYMCKQIYLTNTMWKAATKALAIQAGRL